MERREFESVGGNELCSNTTPIAAADNGNSGFGDGHHISVVNLSLQLLRCFQSRSHVHVIWGVGGRGVIIMVMIIIKKEEGERKEVERWRRGRGKNKWGSWRLILAEKEKPPHASLESRLCHVKSGRSPLCQYTSHHITLLSKHISFLITIFF